MNIVCWHCAKPIQELPAKIPFRFTCPYCDSYLHCCVNCKNHALGYSNQCKVPGTDPIADRQGLNFCDEFEILGKEQAPKANINDISKRLFGDLE